MKLTCRLLTIFFMLFFFYQPVFAQEGTLKWKYVTSAANVLPPAIGPDGTIYLSDIYYFYDSMEQRRKGTYILAINPDGTLKWKSEDYPYSLINNILSVLNDGTIFFTLGDDSGHGYYLSSLKPDGTKNKFGGYYVSKGAFGDFFYFYDDHDYAFPVLYVVNPDGTLNKEIETGAGQPFIGYDGSVYFNNGHILNRLNSIGNIQIIDSYDLSGRMIAIGKDNTLYVAGSTFRALNSEGSLIWEYSLTQVFNCAVDNEGIIYAATNYSIYDDYLFAINPDGSLKWKFREESADKQKIKSPCIGSDGIIYFVDVIYGESYIYALNPDGTFRWRFHTENNITDEFFPMLDKNGSLYVLDFMGTLYSIQTSSKGYQKNAPWPCCSHDNGHTFNAGNIDTIVEENGEINTPAEFRLLQNYPNPFNPTTTISFALPKPGNVEVSVYNIMGQKIRELAYEVLAAGRYSFVWDGRDSNGKIVSSGIYFSRLESGGKIAIGKMLLMK